MNPTILQMMNAKWLQETEPTDRNIVNNLDDGGTVAAIRTPTNLNDNAEFRFCQASMVKDGVRTLVPGCAVFTPGREVEDFEMHAQPGYTTELGDFINYGDDALSPEAADIVAHIRSHIGTEGPVVAHCERLAFVSNVNRDQNITGWAKPGGEQGGTPPGKSHDCSFVNRPGSKAICPGLTRKVDSLNGRDYYLACGNVPLGQADSFPLETGQDTNIVIGQPTMDLDGYSRDHIIDAEMWGAEALSRLGRDGDHLPSLGGAMTYLGYKRRRERYPYMGGWAYGPWEYVDTENNDKRSVVEAAGDWDYRYLCCIGTREDKWDEGRYSYEEIKYLKVYWDIERSFPAPTGTGGNIYKFLDDQIVTRADRLAADGLLYEKACYDARIMACVYSLKINSEDMGALDYDPIILWQADDISIYPHVYVWVCTNFYVRLRQECPFPNT